MDVRHLNITMYTIEFKIKTNYLCIYIVNGKWY